MTRQRAPAPRKQRAFYVAGSLKPSADYPAKIKDR